MPPRPSGTRRRRAAVIAGIAVLVVTTMVLARYAASHLEHTESAAANTAPEAVPAPRAAPAPVAAAHRSHAAGAAVEKSRAPAATSVNARRDLAPQPPLASVAAETAAGRAAAERNAHAPAIAPTAAEVGQQTVTMTGCLESTVDEAEFRLTDVEGADAPQARSWRSGFLKKRPAPVALVELSDPHALRKYVGRRVVATGLLTSGELRVRSFRSAGASCN